MSVEILTFDSIWIRLPSYGGSPSPIVSSPIYRYPFPVPGGVQARYLNKCVDGVTGQWVLWQTLYMDLNGNEYPGTSFDSGTYKVQTIVHDREQ